METNDNETNMPTPPTSPNSSSPSSSSSTSTSRNNKPKSKSPTASVHTKTAQKRAKTRLQLAVEKGNRENKKKRSGCRKEKKYVSMHTKLLIIEKVEQGIRYEDIENKFNVQKPFISKIMAQKSQLRATEKYFVDAGMSNKLHHTKAMKFGKYPLLDKALHIWIMQQREVGIPVVGDVLSAQARSFHNTLYPSDTQGFKASFGYLNRFKARCQLTTKKINGEMVAADEQAAIEYAHNYQSIVNAYSDDQIFNADETGLVYKLLPSRTVARKTEKPSGWKKARERITVLFCANKSGTIRLPLLVVGKSNNPHCFRGIDKNSLPVIYKHQKSAWMTASLFKDWYWNSFIPFVMKKLRRMNIEKKIILFVDNCSAHPHQDELNNISGTVRTEYLPPNTTSLIQPMDQGIIETAKRLYRHRLVSALVSKRDMNLKERLATIDVLYAVREIAHAWSMVKPQTLSKAWYNLTAPSQLLTQEAIHDSNDDLTTSNEHIISQLQEMNINVSGADVDDWVNNDGPSHGFLTDDEIIADILHGKTVTENYEHDENEDASDNSNDKRKDPQSRSTTSIFTVLAWMTGAYTWFSEDSDTTQEQVKAMASLRTYVLTRYHTDNGDQAIDAFVKTPEK